MPTVPRRYTSGDGSDCFAYDVGDGLGVRFDSHGRRRCGTTPVPTVAAGAGAGTGPTVAVAGSTDEHGVLAVTTGTSPAAGTLATVTFARAYAVAPKVVIVSPADSGSAGLNVYASATTTALTIGVHGTPAASTAYKFNWIVVGG